MVQNQRLLDAFNIERKELRSVVLLLTQSLFLGLFYGAFDISAHTLFLQEFEEAMIAQAYSISGVAGIILTFIYSKFQQKIRFRTLSVASIIVLSIITLTLWLGFEKFGTSREIIFLVFILLGPLNIVAIVNFWGIVGRLFSLRQGKRLFGLIGSGQIFGTILISYAIPIINALKLNISTYDLILVGAINLLFAAISQFFLVRLETIPESASKSSSAKKSGTGLKVFLKNNYINSMTIYVVLSMIVLFFVAYTFLAAAQKQYPEEQDMKSFLGIFTGTMMIFGFLLKTFVFSKLLKSYGLRVALLILPVLLVILSSIIIFVYHSAENAFVLVFLLLSMSRLFSMSVRDAIEIPAFKTLYQSLSPNIRHDIQAKIDGTVNELAALSAGLILMGFGFIFELVGFVYTLIIFLLLWILSGLRLYRNYKVSLQETLSSFESQDYDISQPNTNINKKNEVDRLFLKVSNPLLYEHQTTGALANLPDRKLNAFLDEILENKVIKSIEPLEKIYPSLTNKELAEKTLYTVNQLKAMLPRIINLDAFFAKLKEGNVSEISLICKYFRYKPNNLYLPVLILCLRELNPQIKKEAIISSAFYPHDEIIRLLIDDLQNPLYSVYAENSILEIGYKAVPLLTITFQKYIDKPARLEIITNLISKIAAPESINFLLSQFNFYHRNIAIRIIETLTTLDVKIPENKFREFQQAVEQKAQLYSWNLEAKRQAANLPEYLRLALKQEIKKAFNELFSLLSIRYDKSSINQIKSNIESQNSEEIGFAIELMDLFIDEEIKPILFPLLDDIPVEEKITTLSEFFTISIMDNPLLISLLSRGANQLSRWTILCTIMAMLEDETTDYSNELLAHVFNPDKILKKTALIVLYQKNPAYFKSVLERFNFQQRTEAEKLIEESKLFPLSNIFHLTLFLKKLFINFNFNEAQLIKWFEFAEYKVTTEETEMNYNHYDRQIFLLLLKGKISFYNEFSKIAELSKTGSGTYLTLSNKKTFKMKYDANTEFIHFNDLAINQLVSRDRNFFELISFSEHL